MLCVTALKPAFSVLARGRRQYLTFQLILFAVWLVFAGSITPVTVLAGILVTLIPVLLFRHTYRIIGATALFARVPHLARFAVRTALSMVVASFTIAVYAFRPAIALRSTILAYEPGITDRLGLTILALAITVTPGTIVVDRDNVSMYIHVIAPVERSDEQVRASIAALETPLAKGLRRRTEADI